MLKNDLYIDGDNGMKAQHEFKLSVEADHDEALEMNYAGTRLPEYIARVEAQEMTNCRAMTADEAHQVYIDEMARKAN